MRRRFMQITTRNGSSGRGGAGQAGRGGAGEPERKSGPADASLIKVMQVATADYQFSDGGEDLGIYFSYLSQEQQARHSCFFCYLYFAYIVNLRIRLPVHTKFLSPTEEKSFQGCRLYTRITES